jgi:hypothetical protein
MVSEYRPIDVLPGVQPIEDETNLATRHYTSADKIRFVNGKPQKIGGWKITSFDFGDAIVGYARSFFSDFINGKVYGALGTHSRLYSIIGSRLINITPFQTSSTTAANSLDTHYDTLGNNPFAAVDGQTVVTVTDAKASKFKAGDTVTFSGATGFAGILAAALNTNHIVRSVGTGTYTIALSSAATSTASGGGASVVRTSGLVTVNKAAHGLSNGDRVKISGAAAFGGITTGNINLEHIIRNVATDAFDVMTAGTATSSVSAAGGASTVYFPPIPAGLIDESAVQGYGAGLYGVGLYGTALVSGDARIPPRIWFFDRYADTIIGTPGNQTGVYQWDGNTATAPTLIANAPTAVNYAFVSDDIIVTLGAGGVENRIFASDRTDITVWTSSSTNTVYDDDVEGAGRLISHAQLDGYNLLFTENKTYTFRYIGLPAVWEIRTLDDKIGLIAPMARISINGVVYWMGKDNFYMYSGGAVEVIPSNSQNQCTCLRYIFDNINRGQKSKIFCWFNKKYQEIWWHYPTTTSECTHLVRFNIHDRTWTPDTMARTAAEYPNVTLDVPYLFNITTAYTHENGTDDNTSSLPFSLVSDKRYYGKDTTNVNAVIPDSRQLGPINLNIKGWLFPQSTRTMFNRNYTINPTKDLVDGANNARIIQYTWTGNTLGQYWEMGEWLEDVQKGAGR